MTVIFQQKAAIIMTAINSLSNDAVTEKDSDVQQERAAIDVQAGISGLRLMLSFRHVQPRLPVTISILTSTFGHRGVHMSRLVSAAQAELNGVQTVEGYLRNVCRKIDETQPESTVESEFELSYLDQFVRIKVSASRMRPFSYSFLVGGITSCPCSRKTSGIGHMQRASLELDIDSNSALSPNFFQMISKLSECFSSSPVAFLKRRDEAELVLEAQENSRFVEDLVRECLKRFPDARRIEVKSSESIHMHDATAKWVADQSGRQLAAQQRR